MEKRYSIRMRSSKAEEHISGAEMIVAEDKLDKSTMQLLHRARNHSHGQAEEINITIEKLAETEFECLKSLPITTINVSDYQVGRKEANYLLKQLGLEEELITTAIKLLSAGPSPDKNNMRGAVLLNLETGERLEPDQYSGVRATKMDYQTETKAKLKELLNEHNLNQTHLPEALALATKVVNHNRIKAELCLSDDPNYQAGYIASQEFGYCRFPYLKPEATPLGGRIFFVEPRSETEEIIDYLTEKAVLIDKLNNNLSFLPTLEPVK